MKVFWKLFGAFWVFVFPLFFIWVPPFTETTPIMAMVYFALGAVGWLVFIGSRLRKGVLAPRRMKRELENLQRNGKKIQAKITNKEILSTKGFGGDYYLRIFFEFENHSGTKMPGSIELSDSQPSRNRYEEGNYLPLVLADANSDVPYYLADGETVLKKPILTYLFVAFSLLYCVVSFVLEYYFLSNGRGLRFLHLFFPWVVSPYVGLFVFKLFDSVLSGGIFERLNNRTKSKLMLYGKMAIGDVTQVSQTGTYINEQPQMKFTVIYTDDRGQMHESSFKKIVMLEDLHKTKKGKWHLMYLPDEPTVIELLEPVSDKENAINPDDFSKEELADLLNEIISKRKNKE